MNRNKYSETIKKEIINHYEKGLTIEQISKKYPISKSTIYRWTRNNNKTFNNIGENANKEINSIIMENTKLKQELNILKKAIEILSMK
ncbi:helix-turn-helix domain-containing protein [Bacillus cereus]|uniref:transposase n=1 Tax=Bacillus paranthracis TaxID=2026186 RepID=UPI0002B8D3FA|nr:transposase [Bacillus paranthracis]RGO22540.1 helix-turn-helix domain-containing protein [Bacillus cereus]